MRTRQTILLCAALLIACSPLCPQATLFENKRVMLETIDALTRRWDALPENSRKSDPNSRLTKWAAGISKSASSPPEELRWLSAAAKKWVPQRADEGQPLRESLAVMLNRMERATYTDADLNFWASAADDLTAKTYSCRKMGLSWEPKVFATTKRNGTEELKGFEVWYVETFLDGDPSATPHRFQNFSSPAKDSVVPGRYKFWTRSPQSGATGAKLERRIVAPYNQGDTVFPTLAPRSFRDHVPPIAIELLTP
jgi:hypothetical protein